MLVKGAESWEGGERIENEKAAIYTSKLRLNASPLPCQNERKRYRQENRCIFAVSVCAATCNKMREIFSKSRSMHLSVHCSLEN